MRSALYPPRPGVKSQFVCIGIDNTLPEEFARLYPRLVRPPARRWPDLKVNTASIFLMRKRSGRGDFRCLANAGKRPAEKQIILLTGNDSEREAQIEHSYAN